MFFCLIVRYISIDKSLSASLEMTHGDNICMFPDHEVVHNAQCVSFK